MKINALEDKTERIENEEINATMRLIEQINDKEFQSKLSKASPEVCKFFAQLMTNLLEQAPSQSAEEIRDQRKIIKIGTRRYSKEASRLMSLLHDGIRRFLQL